MVRRRRTGEGEVDEEGNLKGVMKGSKVKNSKVEVRDTGKYGLGLFASKNIKKGEIIVDFSDGKVYEAEKCSELPKEIADHAAQFEEHRWIDKEKDIGRYINHSCEPNCGIKNKFEIVVMHDIKKGEELTLDYEMTEDSDWRMECKCGSQSCRKIIGSYGHMPELIRENYKGYISDWLVDKYVK